MNLVVKEKIDVMKKRLSNLAKIDPEEAKINEEMRDEAQEVLSSINEAWKSIVKEFDFSD